MKNIPIIKLIFKTFSVLKKHGINFTYRRIIEKIYFKLHSEAEFRSLSVDEKYRLWIRFNEEAPTPRKKISYNPMISILILITEHESRYLNKCIKSIKKQKYHNWEAFLIPVKLNDNTIMDLSKHADNKHIYISNGNLIEVLKNLKGDYISFFSNQYILEPNALYEIAQSLNQHPEYDLVYTDEDRLSDKGKKRYNPFFKPDWSPDTFLSFIYIGYFVVYRANIVKKIAFSSNHFTESEYCDFAFRFIEQSDNKRIGHIRRILAHRINNHVSDLWPLEINTDNLESVRKVKEDMLIRRRIPGHTELVPGMNQYRVIYDCTPETSVSIIIPSKDNVDLIKQCITSIEEQNSKINYEIIVVDNGSSQENRAEIQSFLVEKEAKYLYEPMEFNFSRMCNIGAVAAQGQFLLFLNDDTKVIQADWLERMTGQAALNHIGAVGAKLLYPDSDIIQHAGVINPIGGPSHCYNGLHDSDIHYFGRNRFDYDLIAVTGACMMVYKEKFEQVGGFDENFPIAYNDIDLCFRLYKAGFYNIIRNDVTLIHFESMSRGLDKTDEKKKARLLRELEALYEKHPEFRETDPFYSNNVARLSSRN